MGKPAAILDVGSSKIVCLVGSSVKDGMAVHGAAVCNYAGYRDGEFLNETSLQEKVIEAISRAEQESRLRIREIAVAVPAPFTKLVTTDATIPVRSRGGRVAPQDIDELISESLKKSRIKDAVLMHSTPVSFTVNGAYYAELPEGEEASELGGTVSHMYADEAFVHRIESILEPIHVEVSMCISATLAEALAIIPEQARVRPAVLIDVGSTNTDVAVAENAALTSIASIPAGGWHFASDLSFGLDIPIEIAEHVKRRYVFDEEPLSPTQIIRMPGGPKRVEHRVIKLIMEARAGELINLIRQSLADQGVSIDAYPVTYLTGGGLAMIKNGPEYLKHALGLPVRRDVPYLPDMNTPNYSSAFGALDFVLRAMGEVYEEEEEPVIGSVVNKLREFFTK